MPHDVIIVLGAALRSGGHPSPTLRRRLDHGVALYHDGAAPALLVTGGTRGAQPSEAAAMARLAAAAGVPEAAITVETQARTTLENARNSARIMAARGWSSALLVTDSVHMPRARLAFRAVGLRPKPAPVRRAWRRAPFRHGWHYLLYEIAGFTWYLSIIAVGAHRR
ncbi:MAG: YdcF family protein [Alphaproteobacteria bacterium]